MYVQLSAVIVDADLANRQELANFLTSFGLNVVAQSSNVDSLTAALSRPDGPQLAIVNLDPGAVESLRKIAHQAREPAKYGVNRDHACSQRGSL